MPLAARVPLQRRRPCMLPRPAGAGYPWEQEVDMHRPFLFPSESGAAGRPDNGADIIRAIRHDA